MDNKILKVQNEIKIKERSPKQKAEKIVCKLIIEINGKLRPIFIRINDNPYDLAFSFITTYNIKKDKINYIVN